MYIDLSIHLTMFKMNLIIQFGIVGTNFEFTYNFIIWTKIPRIEVKTKTKENNDSVINTFQKKHLLFVYAIKDKKRLFVKLVNYKMYSHIAQLCRKEKKCEDYSSVKKHKIMQFDLKTIKVQLPQFTSYKYCTLNAKLCIWMFNCR